MVWWNFCFEYFRNSISAETIKLGWRLSGFTLPVDGSLDIKHMLLFKRSSTVHVETQAWLIDWLIDCIRRNMKPYWPSTERDHFSQKCTSKSEQSTRSQRKRSRNKSKRHRRRKSRNQLSHRLSVLSANNNYNSVCTAKSRSIESQETASAINSAS